MKSLRNLAKRFIEAEHFLLNSAFLLGLFGTVLDYLHATPLPPEWAHQAVVFAGVLRCLDYARGQWVKKQGSGS
jgi:hypothetical protein